MLTSRLHALGIFAFALAWLAYDHYRPWVNFHSEALALLGIGLLLMSRCLHPRNAMALAPRLVWWVMAVALLPWLQYLLDISLFAGDALVVSLFLCALGASIWLGYGYVAAPDGEAGPAPVFYVFWFVALVSAAIGLLQWLNLQESLSIYVVQTDLGDRAMGNLGQPNQLATLLLIGMAALAWTFEQRRIGGLGLAVGAGFMSIVLVLSQSRAGMLSAVAMAVFLVWKSSSTPGRLTPKYVVLWLLAYGAGVFMLPHASELLLMAEARSMRVGADSARIEVWTQMISAIGQSPWLGYGWNQTFTAQIAGSAAMPGAVPFTYAHNIVLDLLVWNGIPVGLALVTAGGYWFVSRIRRLTRPSAVYAMACLLPIGVHSMVEYPFAYAYFLVTTGLMVGIVEASHPGVVAIKLRLRWVGSALTIWLVLGSYMIYEYLLIEEDFRVVRFENLRIGQTPSEYKAPQIWMLSHMGAMLQAARQPVVPGMKKDDLENLRKASLRFPYQNLGTRYAFALGLNGDPSGATQQMTVIRNLHGDGYYLNAVNLLRALQQEKYPELSNVVTQGVARNASTN